MNFERFAALHGLAWHTVQPWQLVKWLHSLAHETPEYRAAELAKVSDAFDSVGLPDPTRSALVTKCISENWGLKPPAGWNAEHIEMWERLPYHVARYIVERRAADLLAVRKCQNLEAALRKADPLRLEAALRKIEEEDKSHATDKTTSKPAAA